MATQKEFLGGGGFKTISQDDFLGGGSFKVIEEQQQKQSFNIPVVKQATEASKGVAKGALSSVVGATDLIAKGQRAFQRLLLPKSLERKFGIDKPAESGELRKIIPEEAITPQTPAEKVGFYGEQIAEFLAPGNVAKKVSQVNKLRKIPGFLGKATRFATRSLAEAGLVGGQTAIQTGEVGDEAKTNAIIAAAFPILTRSAFKLAGVTGKKIQDTVIKPSLSDIKNGFDIKTIQKYNLGGGLKTMLGKTQNKMNTLSRDLKSTLVGSNEVVDLADVYFDTSADLLKNKAKNFGNIKAINRVLGNLSDELDEVVPSLKANLEQATTIKRGAGTKGSWVFGSADPDANAVEAVYTKFYQKLKTAIENKGSSQIQGINKQLSELIPVQSALLKRIPVAERNNLLSLTDSIGLYASVFDPRALALIGAKKLSASGSFANMLLKANNLIKNTPFIGERLIK